MRSAAFVVALLTVARVAGLHADIPGVATRETRQEVPVKDNPFVGSWTANIPKSRLHPRFDYQPVTPEIAASGDTVTLASRLVNASGHEQRVAETFRTDGTETPGTLTPGVTHIARWVGSHVLASIAKKDGQTIALVTYEVSADGKTLTSRSSGMLEQVVVFDSQ